MTATLSPCTARRAIALATLTAALAGTAAADADAQSVALSAGGAAGHIARPTGTAVTLRATWRGRLPRGGRIVYRWAAFDAAGRRTGPVNRAPCPPRIAVCVWRQNSSRAGTWGYRAVLVDRFGRVLASSRALYVRWRDPAPRPTPTPAPRPTPTPTPAPAARSSWMLQAVWQEGASGPYCSPPPSVAGPGTARVNAPWGTADYAWDVPRTIAAGATAMLRASVTPAPNQRMGAAIAFKVPSEFGFEPWPTEVSVYAQVGQSPSDQKTFTVTPRRLSSPGELLHIRLEIGDCATLIFRYVGE